MSDGSGWHLLMLRGLGRECRHWHDFPHQVRKRLPGLGEVLCLDLPGVGAALDVPAPWSIPGIVESVRAEWHSRDPAPGRWCLVTLSLAGMVALDWADRYPDELAGVVLINTSTRRVAGPFARLRLGALVEAVRGAFGGSLETRERLFLERTTNRVRGERVQALVAERVRIAETAPVSLRTLFGQLAAAARFRGPEQLDVPALVAVGRADRLTAPSSSRRLAALLGAPLVEHPEGGHDLATDDGDWLADVLGNWLPQAQSSK